MVVVNAIEDACRRPRWSDEYDQNGLLHEARRGGRGGKEEMHGAYRRYALEPTSLDAVPKEREGTERRNNSVESQTKGREEKTCREVPQLRSHTKPETPNLNMDRNQ